jgi:hypothetical protein
MFGTEGVGLRGRIEGVILRENNEGWGDGDVL